MNLANYFLFSAIVFFSFINVFTIKQKAYSINKFLWLYVFLFWGLVPMLQYYVGIFPWGVDISPSLALKANLLILLWIVFYKISYKLFGGGKSSGSNRPIIKNFSINRLSIILLLVIQLLIMAFFYGKLGGFVLLRGDLSMDMISSSTTTYLIVNQVLRSTSFFIVAAFAYYFKSTGSLKSIFFLALSFTIFLLTNFPLAIARYMAGTFYLGLLFIIKPTFKSKHIPAFIILLFFLVVYPTLTIFRSAGQSVNEISLTASLMPFLTGDFDNFTTLSMTIDYVANYSITFGRQLVGVLFFFVPRSIWLNKPVGSGIFIAETKHWEFTNISCPYVGEGYINFGIMGVILFAIIMGFFTAAMDKRFYKKEKFSFIKLFYPAMLGMIFFVLRGDLLSSFAFTIGFSVAALLTYFTIILPELITIIKTHCSEQDTTVG
jgi:oligosaccharide repeat unit polymerase